MYTTFNENLGKFLLNPEYTNLLFLNFKLWALQYVPNEESEALNHAFKTNDLDSFISLIKQYVPDLETKVIALVKGVDND